MKILNGTGSTDYPDNQIETGVKKLIVKLTLAAFASLDNIRIDVKLNNRLKGTQPILPSESLKTMMEIAAANEGFIHISAIAGPKIVVIGSIELSNAGAIDVKDGYITASFSGLLAGDKIEVFSFDDAVLTREYIQYEAVYFNANAAKEVILAGAYQIAVPKALLSEMSLTFNNGRTITHAPEEIDLICDEINEICIIDETGVVTTAGVSGAAGFIQPGSWNFYTFGFSDAISAKITLSGAGNVYLVKNKTLSE